MSRSENHAETGSPRAHAREMFSAGVAAADPGKAVRRALIYGPRGLSIRLNPLAGTQSERNRPWPAVRLIAVGKAAMPMVAAACDVIPAERFTVQPIAVTNYENARSLAGVRGFSAGHPLPDANGIIAGKAVRDCVRDSVANELVLALISGGGSALLPLPAAGISLKEKTAATDVLLACGAKIHEINTVRKHLSQLKGGGLARLAAPADVHALVLSDVLGDDMSIIASGPTAPDPSTFAAAMDVFSRYDVWARVPTSIRSHLRNGRDGLLADTPKPGDPAFQCVVNTLVGSNRLSLNAIRGDAQAQGYRTQVLDDCLTGEARGAGLRFARAAAARFESNGAGERIALLAGGETTVTLTGAGLGGRNQEMALAFAVAAEQLNLPPNWVFLSAGTDGRDGPTDAAGGLVDPGTLRRIREAGGRPDRYLADNDAYHALQAAGDLLKTGATGTNVADLQILLLHESEP